MRLWLLYLSPSYTLFQYFNVSVREICHCDLRENSLIRLPFVCICLKRIAQYENMALDKGFIILYNSKQRYGKRCRKQLTGDELL